MVLTGINQTKMRLLFIISTLFSLVANAQVIPFMALYPSASAPKVAKVDFRLSGTSTGLTNWNTMAGDPSTGVRSVANMIDTTGASTGWSISSVATANWKPYAGCSCAANNSVQGLTGGSAMPGASTASYQSIWFQANQSSPATYDVTKWQLQIGGLNDSKTYDILIAGNGGTLGFDGRYFVIRATGATSSSTVEIDGGPGGGGGFTTVGTASSGVLTLQPSGGIIKIWINTQTGGTSPSDLASIANMRIKEN